MLTKRAVSKETDIVVLIPCYNNIKGLKQTLVSISKSFIPVDVLVIDDGSNINIDENVLQNIYESTKVIISPKNEGIAIALNRGLRYIVYCRRYRYIARLDAGDRCLPQRFQIQREYLIKYPDVFLVGSWATFVNQARVHLWVFRPPAKHYDICKKMFSNNMLANSAVMLRVDVVYEAGYYPIEYTHAEDYAFYFYILNRFKVANIPEVLTEFVVNSQGISVKYRKQQLRSRIRIILNHFDYSPWAFYGLTRNLILLVLPYSLVQRMKYILFRP